MEYRATRARFRREILSQVRDRRRAAISFSTSRCSGRTYSWSIVHHSDDWVRRYGENDPPTVLYSMHACLPDLLSVHFMLKHQWIGEPQERARLAADVGCTAGRVGRALCRHEQLWEAIVDYAGWSPSVGRAHSRKRAASFPCPRGSRTEALGVEGWRRPTGRPRGGRRVGLTLAFLYLLVADQRGEYSRGPNRCVRKRVFARH